MKRAWIGVAILSASWMFGLNYYYAAQWKLWAIAVIAAIPLLMWVVREVPDRGTSLAAMIILVPMIFAAPWPYRAGAILAALGMLLLSAGIPGQWPKRLGSGLFVAGAVMLAQSLGMVCYESFTARFPDLPGPLASAVGSVGRLIGIDLANHGADMSMFSMRQVHRLGATWALLLDPMSWCFIVGGIAVMLLRSGDASEPAKIGRSLAALAIPAILWLPIRSAILLSIYMHRALRTGYEDSLSDLVDQFWNPWVAMILLIGPVLLACRFAGGGKAQSAEPAAADQLSATDWRRWTPALLVLASAAAFTAAVAWEPVGERQKGRVLVVDYHDQQPWPSKTFDTVRTDQPFTTKIYGQAAAYNHSCLYDYCSRFFTMSRQIKPLTRADLVGVDVLVLKVPSAPYSSDEVKFIT